MSVRTESEGPRAPQAHLRRLGLIGLAALATRGFGAMSQPELPGGALRLDPRTPFFQLVSKDLYGARGQEQLDVSVNPACGKRQWVFDHAELLVGNVRYGGAFIRSAPAGGCARCSPLVVDWYHEPTGQLSFRINVFRRQVFVPCATQAPESRPK